MTSNQIAHVNDIHRKAFPDLEGKALSRALFAILLEEAGELAGASRKYFGKRLRPEHRATQKDIEEEFGDVLFVLARIAGLHGISAPRALDTAIAKFVGRMEQCQIDPTPNS